MPISDEKLLQRIVKKYDLIPYDYSDEHRNIFKPKPTGLIEFNGGIIKIVDKGLTGLWLCETDPDYDQKFKRVTAFHWVLTSRENLHKNIKKILKFYKECNLKAKHHQIQSKLKQIDKDF